MIIGLYLEKKKINDIKNKYEEQLKNIFSNVIRIVDYILNIDYYFIPTISNSLNEILSDSKRKYVNLNILEKIYNMKNLFDYFNIAIVYLR